MATLAIKGHATRGKEVIEILETLGGKKKYLFKGDFLGHIYFINQEGCIDQQIRTNEGFDIYTLEEFLEKYPYKVGDKVIVKGLSEYPKIINFMKWVDGDIHYSIDNETWFLPSALQPYKEETMEIKPNQIKNNSAFIDLSNAEYNNVEEIELLCLDKFDVKQDGTKLVLVKKSKYPKSYAECAEVIGWASAYIDGYNGKLIKCLQKLLICRDTYWKIAGEEMGLGKPWEPEYLSKHYIFTIENCGGNIIKNAITDKWRSRVLVFPTEEMCDMFYENFKEMIEVCKELL